MDSQTKPRDASPQGRVTRNATRLQKRQLEDPGDISISRAQPKKKNKPKKKDVVAANVPTAPSLNTTPRTTVSSPAPAQVVSSVPSPTAPPTLGPDAPSPAVPAASQTQGKKKKKKAPTNQPSNASAPPATEPPNTPEQGTEKVAKRVKNPSPIAREGMFILCSSYVVPIRCLLGTYASHPTGNSGYVGSCSMPASRR
jgi:hypothetical protein